MGYSLSWTAVKGRSPEEVHRLLGVKGTGRTSNYGDHPLVGRLLPNGWYIVIADSSDNRIVHKDTLALLSEGGRAVACSLEEHVMASSCSFWSKGKKDWSVEHESERGVFDVKTTGNLPEGFSRLREQLSRDQEKEGGEKAEVDLLFDLPLELAKQYTGFKHDEVADSAVDEVYEVLDAGPVQTISHTIAAAKPWVLFFAAILVLGFVLAAAGDLVKWAIKYLSKVIQ
ncbi:MAG: hypothetical protein ACYC7L_17745 [Nitrospirota bacterium]